MMALNVAFFLITTLYTASAKWELEAWGMCNIIDNCVQDWDGNYKNDGECTFYWRGSTNAYAVTEEFDLESHPDCDYDYLTISNSEFGNNGYRCEPEYMPKQFRLNDGMRFYFSTDEDVAKKGFKFCAHDITPCTYSAWGDYDTCSVSCGGGTQIRTRTISAAPSPWGKQCDEDLSESRECNKQECPPAIDCKYTAWNDWGSCDEDCAGGKQFRARNIRKEAQNGGVACDDAQLSDMRRCNEHVCPVDCLVGQWGDWGACSADCSGGSQTRTREILRDVAGEGAVCGDLEATRSCNEQPCPVPCETSEWGAYGECDASCGGGQKVSNRVILTHPAYGGAECGDLSRSKPCGEHPCPVDCTLSDFGEWSECSASCGGGIQTKERRVMSEARHGGSCEELTMSRACNEDYCPCDYTTNVPAPDHGGCCPFTNLIYKFDFSPEKYEVDILGCCEAPTTNGECFPPTACLFVENVKGMKVKGAGKGTKLELTESDDTKVAACQCAELCAEEPQAAYWLMTHSWNFKLKCTCYTGNNVRLAKVFASDDKSSGFAGGFGETNHDKLVQKAS